MRWGAHVQFERNRFGFEVPFAQHHRAERRVFELHVDLSAVELRLRSAAVGVRGHRLDLQEAAALGIEHRAVDLELALDHVAVAELLDAFGQQVRVADFERRLTFAFAPVRDERLHLLREAHAELRGRVFVVRVRHDHRDRVQPGREHDVRFGVRARARFFLFAALEVPAVGDDAAAAGARAGAAQRDRLSGMRVRRGEREHRGRRWWRRRRSRRRARRGRRRGRFEAQVVDRDFLRGDEFRC